MSFYSLLFGKTKAEEDDSFIKTRAPIRRMPEPMLANKHLKRKNDHVYFESGKGRPVIFSHGLFGGIFNIDKASAAISEKYRFLMPYLPMYDMSLKDCTVQKLGDYLQSFTDELNLDEAVFIGSSMGGGASLYFALKNQSVAKGLVLCGSSGLSNIPLSKGYFKRKNFDFLKEATQDIFFNRSVPPDEMVEDIYNAIQDYEVVLRSIRFTKAATNYRMKDELPRINVPSLLLWGRQDPITPVEIAPEFLRLLPDAELHIIEECGHVPTQEKPDEFLKYFFSFMNKIGY